VIAYGVAANVCFTGGWIVEIGIRQLTSQQRATFARASFAIGFFFSIDLTLVPAVLAAALRWLG
jgi:heme/copper-type cytochrome/quinol oxidase subunit 4